MARHFTNWLRAYMDYTRDSESPDSFHFWCGVSTIAGALRRRVWLDMRKFQWTPNFYIILVGPPGVAAKSTSISIGTRLLSKIPGIAFGPESMTWQALADSLSSATEFVKYYLPSGEEAATPMSALTVTIGELGTFLTMDDDKLLSFLIRMWEGQQDSFLHKTKTQGQIEVRNPWLNIIGATTPAWLRAHFPAAMIGGGLTSRIVFVYGDKKRHLVPYPDEVIPFEDYSRHEAKLVEDLQRIALLSGPYVLSPAARDWGRSWYAGHWNGHRAPHMASDRYGGYISRKQTHIHKFAIILAAAKGDKLVIEERDLMEAEAIISSIEPDMIKVFESIGIVDEARQLAEISAFVRQNGTLTVEELWSLCMNVMPMKDFGAAVVAGVRGGLLMKVQKGGKDAVRIADGK
jgi:Protein of unknown function (DUF3987)